MATKDDVLASLDSAKYGLGDVEDSIEEAISLIDILDESEIDKDEMVESVSSDVYAAVFDFIQGKAEEIAEHAAATAAAAVKTYLSNF